MQSYFQIILSSAAIYIFIVAAIRLFGKKELAQLTVIDLVFILLISNAVQNAMVGADTSLLGGLTAAGTLFAVNALLKYLFYRFPKLEKMIQGEPVILIYKGKLNPEHMKKVSISKDELDEVIREHGVADVSEVDLAVLEVDGNISVLSENFQHRTTRKRKSHRKLSKATG